MILKFKNTLTYFYSSRGQQMLCHALGHNLKEKVCMMHELVNNQKVGIIRIQNSGQMLGKLLVNRGASLGLRQHKTVLHIRVQNVLAVVVAQHVHQIDHHSDNVQADLLAGCHHQQAEELIEQRGQKGN